MKGNAKRAGGYEALRKLVRGLREVASGQTLTNTIVRVNRYLAGRVRGELDKHISTGLARNTAKIVPSKSSIDITLQSYRRYIKWSFAKGIPMSALNRAQKILAEELARSIKQEGST